MPAGTIGIGEIRRIRQSILANDPAAVVLLEQAASRRPASMNAIRELNDLLLFCTAYPGSSAISEMAESALRQMVESGAEGALRSTSDADRLRDSGLAGSETVGCYSYELVRWAMRRVPEAIALHSVDAPLDELIELIRPLLPRSSRESLELPYADAEELLDALFGRDPRSRLRGLLALLETAGCADEYREMLFARMQVYVSLRCGHGFPSLQQLRDASHPKWLHAQGIMRHVDLAACINLPIALPLNLGRRQALELIDRARMTLAIMQRETDPITYAGTAEVFDMGRGLRIGLFHLEPRRRLMFDSYVGFMAYKNGLPIAYGGAWVFPGKTRVGINIFPYARGGESSWFFAQLLRLYKQRFDVRLFEAENYQLGHGNEDGLKSGAYWFYYRLGFRPWAPDLATMAAAEFVRSNADRHYRTPVRLLKRLVADGLQLRVGHAMIEAPDTATLLHCASNHVREVFGGDSKRAESTAMRRAIKALGGVWSGEALDMLRLWAPALDMIPEWHEWPTAERHRLARIIRSKAGRTETQHQLLLLGHARLLQAWDRKVARM